IPVSSPCSSALSLHDALPILLETQELHDAEVDRGMEAQAALVGTQRRVVLHAEGAVDADRALVIDPGHPEDDLTLRLAQTHQDPGLVVPVLMHLKHFERISALAHGLVDLGLAAATRRSE